MNINFSNNIDRFGLIVQNIYDSADGGDSAHRFGNTYFCLKLLGEEKFMGEDLYEFYCRCIAQYEAKKDTYRRHPDPSKWYSNPNNFTRDQTVMLMAAMMVQNDKQRMRGLAWSLIKRAGFHQNYHIGTDTTGVWYKDNKIPDPTTPAQVATFIRALDMWYFYPLLYILDAFLLADIYFSEKHDQKKKLENARTDYHTMLCIDMIKPALKYDTFVAKLARKLYRKLDYKGAIAWIFRPDSNCPPIDELLIPVCKKYIDND